jgi:predicted Rossmann fold nucleotide-binding protein DprA/Smf involved in DNA uptake
LQVNEMRTIIAGSRNIEEYSLLLEAIKSSGIEITSVVSGGAPGVDTLGERYAEENSLTCTRFPANWEKYGKAAGPIRNRLMAANADALIAIWDGKSPGTKNMIQEAEKKGLQVYIAIQEE